MLNYSDKSLRKLQENLACYAEKLSDKEVYDYFTSILSKSKKVIKQESKVICPVLFERKVEMGVGWALGRAV